MVLSEAWLGFMQPGEIAASDRNYELLKKNHNYLFSFLIFGSVIQNMLSTEIQFF
jgi:hypothetical protein